jgi:hypothetical protein
MPMSVSEGSCVSDAGTMPMISVCPSLMPIQIEPGWDHTLVSPVRQRYGYGSHPARSETPSDLTYHLLLAKGLSYRRCRGRARHHRASAMPPGYRTPRKHRHRAVAPHSSQLRSSSRRPYLPRALTLDLKVTCKLQADSHSSVVNVLQIGLFYSAVWTAGLMLWGYRTVFCTAVDACPLAG